MVFAFGGTHQCRGSQRAEDHPASNFYYDMRCAGVPCADFSADVHPAQEPEALMGNRLCGSGDGRNEPGLVLSLIHIFGKKTAQRIILELKGKVDPAALGADAAPAGAADGGAIAEAVAILEAMGFATPDAASAVALVKADGGTSEQMAMRALRALDRK